MRSQSIAFGLLVSLSALPSLAAAQSTATERSTAAHPDLSGTWDNGSGIDFVRPRQDGESICVSGCGSQAPPGTPPPAASSSTREPAAGAPRGPSKPQYKQEFAAKVEDLRVRQVQEDPVLRCFAPGVPRIGPPDKIVQGQNEVVFLYDDVSGNFFRIVPTDGRPHPGDKEPSYLGDAVGRWEGDTLVVETVNFNALTWLTDDGAFHTPDLRVVERLRRNGDTLEWTATAYDPAVLVAPWELTKRTARRTDLEIVEAPPCIERDIDHMVDGSHHPNPR
jgi:hypothetical protein